MLDLVPQIVDSWEPHEAQLLRDAKDGLEALIGDRMQQGGVIRNVTASAADPRTEKLV